MEEETKKSGVEIKISRSMFGTIFSALAVIVFMIVKILNNFGVYDATLHGIIAIVIYGLAVVGLVFNALLTRKFNSPVWLSIAVLAFVLLVI